MVTCIIIMNDYRTISQVWFDILGIMRNLDRYFEISEPGQKTCLHCLVVWFNDHGMSVQCTHIKSLVYSVLTMSPWHCSVFAFNMLSVQWESGWVDLVESSIMVNNCYVILSKYDSFPVIYICDVCFLSPLVSPQLYRCMWIVSKKYSFDFTYCDAYEISHHTYSVNKFSFQFCNTLILHNYTPQHTVQRKHASGINALWRHMMSTDWI